MLVNPLLGTVLKGEKPGPELNAVPGTVVVRRG